MGFLISIDEKNATERRLPNGGLVISIPIKMRMRSRHKAIIMPADVPEDGAEPLQVNDSLVLGLVRAHTWNALLESGRFNNIPELAAAVNFERSYVSRTLELVNLDPDIALAVLKGDEPEGLHFKKLRQGIPVLWEEQRERLGITSEANPATVANAEGV